MEQKANDKGKMIVEKFFKEYKEHAIYESNLGWDERNAADAGFTESSKIFYYYMVEIGFNLLKSSNPNIMKTIRQHITDNIENIPP